MKHYLSIIYYTVKILRYINTKALDMKTLIKLFVVFLVVSCGLNMANAQNLKKDRQAAKEASIKKMVDEMHYVFEANYVNPSRGDGRSLTSDYDLRVSKDKIVAYLPYFGRAYVSPSDLKGGGIDFTITNFEYSVTEGKKGGWDVVIKPKDKNISDFKLFSLYLFFLLVLNNISALGTKFNILKQNRCYQ